MNDAVVGKYNGMPPTVLIGPGSCARAGRVGCESVCPPLLTHTHTYGHIRAPLPLCFPTITITHHVDLFLFSSGTSYPAPSGIQERPPPPPPHTYKYTYAHRFGSLYASPQYSGMSAAHSASAAKAAARRLLRLALDQGSVDDVTVVVSVFAWE